MGFQVGENMQQMRNAVEKTLATIFEGFSK